MKKYSVFITRLAIINFLVFTLAIAYMAYASPAAPVKTENNAPISETPPPTPTPPPPTDPAAEPTPKVEENNTSQPAVLPEPTPPPALPKTLTPQEEVLSHNTPSDCWIVYKDHIYNITPAFGSHPGGDAVMAQSCGTDATTAFDTKDKNPARPHSATAQQMLSQYLVK